MSTVFRLGLGAIFWLLLAVCSGTVAAQDAPNRLLKSAWDASLISGAIKAERQGLPEGLRITGVGVPHHLIAPDLIARGLLAAGETEFDTIVLLSPDHFRVTRTAFGVTTDRLDTVFGALPPAPRIAEAFLDADGLAQDIATAPREHGIHAITPFIAALYPDTSVVAITVSVRSTPADWDRAVATLAAHVTDRTLIVQSTDYSHFLPHRLAIHRDQETLAALAAGTADAILALQQPTHLDTLGAQYIQTQLQQRRFDAAPAVIGNRNSHTGAGPLEALTTSYVVTAYSPDPVGLGHLRYGDHAVTYLAGDTFLGRSVAPLLADPEAREVLVRTVRTITGGAPLLVNLEGTILDAVPAGRSSAQHLMLADATLPMLDALGIRTVSLANNHAFDFGPDGLAQSKAHLAAAGIAALEHGQVTDVGTFRVLPLTFRRSYFAEHPVIRSPAEIAGYCDQPAEPPVIAFLHWGGDYKNPLGAFERDVVAALERCGVSAVIGAHSHIPVSQVLPLEGGAVPTVLSLGNFLFDQDHPQIGGTIAEVRSFAQGTVALRLIPIGNLYSRAVAP